MAAGAWLLCASRAIASGRRWTVICSLVFPPPRTNACPPSMAPAASCTGTGRAASCRRDPVARLSSNDRAVVTSPCTRPPATTAPPDPVGTTTSRAKGSGSFHRATAAVTARDVGRRGGCEPAVGPALETAPADVPGDGRCRGDEDPERFACVGDDALLPAEQAVSTADTARSVVATWMRLNVCCLCGQGSIDRVAARRRAHAGCHPRGFVRPVAPCRC